jgi:hypothetical protein
MRDAEYAGRRAQREMRDGLEAIRGNRVWPSPEARPVGPGPRQAGV